MLAEAPGVMTGGARAAVVEALVDLVLAVLDDEERARAVADCGARANPTGEAAPVAEIHLGDVDQDGQEVAF